MRRCVGKRSAAGPLLIAAGLVILVFALPLRFWAAAIGSLLVVAGLILISIDR